jgi:thiol-disulfide isomerase/thioredoxin
VFLDGPPPFGEVLGRVGAEGKGAFVDFTTEWCGWCRVLEEEVFPAPEAASALAGFVAVRYDAEKGEGIELARRYRVEGFPTLVFVDAEGREIDRIVGYRPLPAFVAEVERISRDEGTLRALRRAWEADAGDPDAGLSLVAKLTEIDPAEAGRVLDLVAASPGASSPAVEAWVLLARGRLGEAAHDAAGALAAYEAVVGRFASAPEAVGAALSGARLANGLEQADRGLALLGAVRDRVTDLEAKGELHALEVALHRVAASAAARAWGEAASGAEDPRGLNESAWTVFLHRLAVPEAVAWARRAVALTDGEDADVLDTLANLLFQAGEVDEAVAVEKSAWEKSASPRQRALFHELWFKFRAVQVHRRGDR